MALRIDHWRARRSPFGDELTQFVVAAESISAIRQTCAEHCIRPPAKRALKKTTLRYFDFVLNDPGRLFYTLPASSHDWLPVHKEGRG